MHLVHCLNTSGLKFMLFQSNPEECIWPDSTHFFQITYILLLQAYINLASRTKMFWKSRELAKVIRQFTELKGLPSLCTK